MIARPIWTTNRIQIGALRCRGSLGSAKEANWMSWFRSISRCENHYLSRQVPGTYERSKRDFTWDYFWKAVYSVPRSAGGRYLNDRDAWNGHLEAIRNSINGAIKCMSILGAQKAAGKCDKCDPGDTDGLKQRLAKVRLQVENYLFPPGTPVPPMMVATPIYSPVTIPIRIPAPVPGLPRIPVPIAP